jgi:hypothetical protein
MINGTHIHEEIDLDLVVRGDDLAKHPETSTKAHQGVNAVKVDNQASQGDPVATE